MKTQLNRILFYLAFAFVIQGCSYYKQISIESKPEGADLFLDNKYIGKTPLQSKFVFQDSKTPLRGKLRADAYEDSSFTISYHPKEKVKYVIELVKKDTVNLELVRFEPLLTNAGIKLSKITVSSLAYLEIIERSPNVKSPRKVTTNEEKKFQIGAPVISPNGKNIAYYIYSLDTLTRIGYTNIWRQPVSGVARTRLTSGTNMDLYPSYSPDGNYIFFSSTRNNDKPALWKIRDEGAGGLTSITRTLAEDFSPVVVSDNLQLVYTSLPSDATEPQIWSVNMNGTLPTQLREGEFPNAAPDGKKILFMRKDRKITITRYNEVFNPAQIWFMDMDGSNETQLTQNSEYNCIQAKWSPDGKWIAYASDEGKDMKGLFNYDIWMMKSDGTGKTQLTTNGSWDDFPEWSPDGKRIYFRSNRGGYWNIWYVDLIMPK